MEHCSSLPLWRPDRRVQQISGGTGHRPSRSDVPCRDDGSGQTARWVVATRPRVRRLVGLFLNGHPQVAASRRPRTEASARRSDNAREGLTTDGPLQKPDFLFEFLVVAFDPPAQLGNINELTERYTFWKRRQPVFDRLFLAIGPFDQQPLLRPAVGEPVVPMRHTNAHAGKSRGQLLRRGFSPCDLAPGTPRQAK